MDFMDKKVPKQIKDFIVCVETVNNFCYRPRFCKPKRKQ